MDLAKDGHKQKGLWPETEDIGLYIKSQKRKEKKLTLGLLIFFSQGET